MLFTRDFPLPRPLAGAKGGNGLLGLLLWGEGRTLNLSLGASDLWDHRGGMDWKPEMSYRALLEALRGGDLARVQTMFAANRSRGVARPALLPVGRIVLTLPAGAELVRFRTFLEDGRCEVVFTLGGETRHLSFVSDMACRHGFACHGLPEGTELTLAPSWRLGAGVSERSPLGYESLAMRGIQPPEEGAAGGRLFFLQQLPADPPYAVVVQRNGADFSCDYLRGSALDMERLRAHALPTYQEVAASAKAYWRGYWADMPAVATGDPGLDECYWHGLYQYGIMLNPNGCAPGLQGPWMEDHATPPWSGDFHLNINLQMILSPGFHAGTFPQMRLLLDKVLSWRPTLRENARSFLGIENGYVLPHAVDDTGVCQGGFWTGSVDHACGAWIAAQMFRYCLYTGDTEYLRRDVFDFMVGVMRVYEAVLQRGADGLYGFPLGVSPEFGGDQAGSCGRNASFQLAALHRHLRNLRQATAWLGVPMESKWLEIEAHLPEAAVHDGEIALWEDFLLPESHRHHSHLAGIYPFCTISPDASEWREIVAKSMTRWIRLGCGEWTGWSLPWAAILHLRTHHPLAAIHLLRTWQAFFNNEGGASLHDACHPGFTYWSCLPRGEIMQMDGAMGAVVAIQELFAYEEDEALHFGAGFLLRWQAASCRGMVLSCGLLASGTLRDGRWHLRLRATRPIRRTVIVRNGPPRAISLQAGEEIELDE